MTATGPAVLESYAACHRLCRQAGSNFVASFFLLPRQQRAAMHALYAFMRHTDDLADNPHPEHLRTQALTEWRAALEHALLSEGPRPVRTAFPAGAAQGPDEQTGAAILPAVADAVRRFHIPPEHLRAVIDGVEMDLTTRRYATFAELERYCQLVASAVGLACIHVWGFQGPEPSIPARKCGVAMQLTNILRDLADDAAQDRVYLPLEDLQQCDYTSDDLAAGVADARFGRLVELEAARAETCFREGAELLDVLAPDGRRMFGMMMTVYRALLRKIARRPARVFRGRVRLGGPRKLWIAARWLLLPPRSAALR